MMRKLNSRPSKRQWLLTMLLALACIAGPTTAPTFAIGVETGGGGDSPEHDPDKPTTPGSGSGSGTPTHTYRTVNSYIIPRGSYVVKGCAAYIEGDETRINLGVTYLYQGPLNFTDVQWFQALRLGDADRATMGVTLIKTTCRYAPGMTMKTVRAVIKSTASVEITTPEGKKLITKTMSSAWSKKKTVANALKDERVSAKVNHTPTQFGRYKATAVTTVQDVVVALPNGKDWGTGETAKAYIASVGKPYTVNRDSARGQLDCSGWKDYWTSKTPDWSWTECDGDRDVPACVAPKGKNPVLIDGEKRDESTLFRNGTPVALTWTPASTKGLKRDTGVETRFTRSGTPYASINGSTKPADALLKLAYKKSDQGTKLVGKGAGTAWVKTSAPSTSAFVRGMWSSKEGQPTVITPEWRFTGTYAVRTVKITGLDSDGKWVTETVTRNVRSTLTCKGSRATLNFVRGVSAS